MANTYPDLVGKPTTAKSGNIMAFDADKNAVDSRQSIRSLKTILEQKDVPGKIAGYALALGG